jgi:hypothetical protein
MKVSKPTSCDIIASSAELLKTLEIGISDAHLLKLDGQAEHSLWDMRCQRLRVWPVNDFSRHLCGIVLRRMRYQRLTTEQPLPPEEKFRLNRRNVWGVFSVGSTIGKFCTSCPEAQALDPPQSRRH